jgi:hypothetical protein
VVRGDVVQFFESHFRDARGGQKWAGAPDHTSVVVGGMLFFLLTCVFTRRFVGSGVSCTHLI